MWLKQADDLLAGWNLLTAKNPAVGLADDPLDQRTIMAQFGLPDCDLRIAHLPKLDGCLLGIGHGRPSHLDQVAIMLKPVRPTARELDQAGSLFRGASMIAPHQFATVAADH